MRFLVTAKCRANGRFVAAGEILDTTNSDEATLKALNDGGRGRFIADDAKQSPPNSTDSPPPEATVGSKPEVPDPKPLTRRGRPRKE